MRWTWWVNTFVPNFEKFKSKPAEILVYKCLEQTLYNKLMKQKNKLLDLSMKLGDLDSNTCELMS